MNTQHLIERFIIDELCEGSRPSINPDEPLISSGIVDSLAMLRLITFIEQQFGLTVGDGEVGPENFETVRRIALFLDRKQAEGAGTR